MKLKKMNKSILLCIILSLLIGALIGYFSTSYLTRNDKFQINGEKNITLNLNQEYKELGAVAISYGKDLSDKIEIESNLDITTEGEYTIIYTIKDSYKYKNIKRVRYVTVGNGGVNNG